MKTCTCPNCGTVFAAPVTTQAPARARRVTRKRTKPQGANLWTRVDFADGVTVLRSNYRLPDDVSAPVESAIRLRAAALAGGNYALADMVRTNVPAVVGTVTLTDLGHVEHARALAFVQREGAAGILPGWGNVLTDPAASWTGQRVAAGGCA